MKLKMAPEEGLAVTLSLNTPAKLARYSKAIKNYLSKGKRNWLANFYASNYWRVVGNVPEAVMCLRNAAALAPEPSRHLGLLGLANICHRTHHSDEAISILNKATDLAPGLSKSVAKLLERVKVCFRVEIGRADSTIVCIISTF